jgi:hypothetical protein
LAVRERWQYVIDHVLVEWGCNPNIFEEDIESPKRSTIQRAINLAEHLKTNGFPAPSRVVPDAQGGIVFERKEQQTLEILSLSPDGDLEFALFQNARLLRRDYLGHFPLCIGTGDLRQHGIDVIPRPLPDDPGHAELPDLNATNRLEDLTFERKVLLTKLAIEVQGPFHQSSSS